MTELIVLTKEQAQDPNNSGFYKENHKVEPLEIEDGVYVLNRDLSEVPELADYKEAILAAPYFVIGDGSEYDKIYQEYLKKSTN